MTDFHMDFRDDPELYKRLRVWDLRRSLRYSYDEDTEHPSDFTPAIPEICIKLFTKEGDIVLDPFCGRGTTVHVAHDLNRRGIGIDINPKYIEDSKRISSSSLFAGTYDPLFLNTDSRSTTLPSSCVKLLVTSPPFWDQITYDESLEGDLSNIHSLHFFTELEKCFDEWRRVLRPDGIACIVCDDYHRKSGEFIPCQYYFIKSLIHCNFKILDIKILLLHVYRHFNYLTIVRV